MAKPRSIELLKAGINDDIKALVGLQRSTLTLAQQMGAAFTPLRTFDLNDAFEADLFSVLERGARELMECKAAEAVQQEGDEVLRPAKRSSITEPIYSYLADLWLNTGFDPLHGAPGAAFRADPTLNRLRGVANRTLTNFSLTRERTGGAAPKVEGAAPAQPCRVPKWKSDYERVECRCGRR